MSTPEIIDCILGLLQPTLKLSGLTSADVNHDESLLQQGLMDSIHFIDLITQLETEFDIVIEFDDLDVSDFTSVTQLAQLVGTALAGAA